MAGGWGNRMWRLGDELVVRMQRMDPSAELQLKERRWLPVLAPLEVALDLTFVRDRLPSLLGQGAAMWAV